MIQEQSKEVLPEAEEAIEEWFLNNWNEQDNLEINEPEDNQHDGVDAQAESDFESLNSTPF